MKKRCSLLATCLVVITCLASEKEAKSEPFSAIFLGVVWTVGQYALPAIPFGIVAFQKVKEYVTNRSIESIREDLDNLKKTVDKNATDAAKDRGLIKATQQEHGVHLRVLRKGQQAIRAEVKSKLARPMQDLRNELGVAQDDLTALLGGQGELGSLLNTVNKTSQSGFEDMKKRLSRLEKEIEEIRKSLGMIQKQQKRLLDDNGVVKVKIQAQGEEIFAARKDCKKLVGGADQLAEKVGLLSGLIGQLVQKKTEVERMVEHEGHMQRDATIPSPEQLRLHSGAIQPRPLITSGPDCSLE